MNTEEIDNLPSRPFKGVDWSEHTAVSRLVDTLYAEYAVWYKDTGPGKRLRDKDKVKQHLTHFVLEAYRTHRALPELAMGVHLSKEYYRPRVSRYHPNHLSYRIVEHVTDFLVAADHLELPFGKSGLHLDPRLRRTTRHRATARLIDLCDEYGINPYMIVPYKNPEAIIQRAKRKYSQAQGDPVDYKDTPFTRRARKNLRKVNRFIAGHHINLDITDEQEDALMLQLLKQEDPAKEKFLDFTKIRLRRIFNNSSFEEGGRFYGVWWQQILSNWRYFITIDSKLTVELDYSGMHFAIMYANLGMDIPMDDPYALTDYDSGLRGHIKKAFNIIVNCATREEAVGAIDRRIKKGELSDKLISGKNLLQAFINTHPLIEDKIASGEGVRGQFTDSLIAEKILLKGIDIGLCILPIHDGFITTNGDGFILERLMNEAFKEVTGRTAKINPETFDMSTIPDARINRLSLITRPDRAVERDDPLEGKAISNSAPGSSRDNLWEGLVKDTEKKKNKNKRDKEWKAVHGPLYR